MAPSILPVLLVLVTKYGCLALRWQSGSTIPNGTTVPACTGQGVTLPWAFTLEAAEHIHDIQWRFSPPGQTGKVIATYTEGNFFAIPSFSQKLTFVPNAGLRLDSVTHDDVGSYTVEVDVMLHGSSSFHTQTATLEMPDTPVLTGGHLQARVLPLALFDADTGEWHVRLECGHFVSFGQPQISIVWKTPSGAILPSSSQDGDSFILNIPNPVEDGVYTCQPDNSSLFSACNKSDSPSGGAATVSVDSLRVQFAVMEGKLHALQGENTYLTQKVENLTEEVQTLRELNGEHLPRSCKDVLAHSNVNGVHTIYVNGTGMQVYCDQATSGGGWTVIQRRVDGKVDFYRNWTDYERGFGDLTHEFWLGLDKIHRLTSSNNYSLRVDLEDFDGSTAYAEYRDFSISGPDDFYRLHVGRYSGTAGDSIDVASGNQNNQQFTTRDQDHDPQPGNCARDSYHGAWWYSSGCGYANLNGEYKADGARGGTGITWHYWKKDWRSYKHVEMKVKPWS